MEYLGYVAWVGIGIVLSLMGGGGSLLSVPILVYAFSLDVVTASSYSFFVVGVTSLLGALSKQKEQGFDFRSGIVFSVSSVAAIFLMRRWVLPWVPEEFLCDNGFIVTKRAIILGVFAFLAMTSSLIILAKVNNRTIVGEGHQKLKLMIPIAFATGILVGLVGVGGGFLILPSLLIFGRLPFKTAVGTTLLVISLNSLLGFLGDITGSPINWIFLSVITGLAALGMFLGNLFGTRIPVHYLRSMFGWIMLVTAIGILVKEWIL